MINCEFEMRSMDSTLDSPVNEIEQPNVIDTPTLDKQQSLVFL